MQIYKTTDFFYLFSYHFIWILQRLMLVPRTCLELLFMRESTPMQSYIDNRVAAAHESNELARAAEHKPSRAEPSRAQVLGRFFNEPSSKF